MLNSGLLSRLKNGGYKNIIFSLDWVIALLATILLYYTQHTSIAKFKLSLFIDKSVTLSGSLIAVILTGVAILISLADDEFLQFIQQENFYDKLMSIFEAAVLLSIFVTVLGISILTIGVTVSKFYMFLFFFLYLIFAVISLISAIITFGDKMGKFKKINDIDENFGENVDLVHEDDVDDSG